jgi:P2 family phage major capsid protein
MSHPLSQLGRQRLDDHFAKTALAYGIDQGNAMAGQHFSATPSVTQSVMKKIVETGAGFLASIATIPVTEIKGQKVLVGVSSRVASRTDTSGSGERTPKNLLGTSTQDYELFPTEWDVALKYADIDAWAKFPNFSDLYMQAVREAIANDILQTGWTGTSAATNTNLTSNPLLQDLNIGWLKKIRDFNGGSQHVIGTTGNPVQLGGTIFKNLDQLALAAKQKIQPQFRMRGDLVLLVADDVMSNQEDTYFELNGNKPTEKAVMSGLITKSYAGMPAIVPPFMPNGTLLVTPLQNLAYYYQDSSYRRLQRDWPSKNQVQEFNSVNDGYVVQEELATCLIENITFA